MQSAIQVVLCGLVILSISLCSHQFLLKRLSVPPTIVEIPESQTRPRAGTARFMCQAEGVPSPRISWLKNGEEVHLNGRIKMYNRYFISAVMVRVKHT